MNRHFPALLHRCRALILLSLLLGLSAFNARAEQILELFNCTWAQVTQKMPEIAEAGYDALWLPPPAKGASGGYSVGYDQFDPFDLGNLNQAGSVATRYGTEAQLLQMVQVAHRFGIRVYFDNIMNHRATTVPGYNAQTPTNFYPGLVPQDFHLQTTTNGYYQNWPSIQDFNNQWDVQNEPLSGLVDLANEPGSVNNNFGPSLGSTITKPVFVRQPFNPAYYMDTNGVSLGGPWHPFDGHGQPVPEDVSAYLIRAAMWTLYTTKCDGFRLDAVKHVPSGFFGDSSPSFNGYVGGIQAMYDYVHGYGSNVLGNGYIERDDMRNSCFDTEVPRNDAMLFGEHLGPPPSMGEYILTGMRLLNTPLHNVFNNNLGNPSAGLQGLDSATYTPPAVNGNACFPVTQGVQYAQNQDSTGAYANHRDLQDAYNFMQQGIGIIYTDDYNQSGPPSYFPTVADANAFGEYGDDQMPELAWIHNQMARGEVTWPRWSDNDIVLFERADNREGTNTQPQNQDVVLFGMNDNYGYPGDTSFDDGISRTPDGYYGGMPVSNSRGLGVVVGFPPGSVIVQMAKTSSGANRAYAKLLVHGATQSTNQAIATANDPVPQNRLIYVGGQTLAQNGGAVELTVPSGGYVMYGYQWPEASRAALKPAITLRQGGVDAPRVIVDRQDGTNGDAGFNPIYPFAMRGSVDQYGNVIGGTNVGNLTYAIDVPVVTNANFDIVVENDASSANTLIKLDGGVDINSQMGLGPTNGTDLRDNKPGYATDVFLGYEQSAFQFQNGPEKFAARNILSNNIVSLGAETYYYTVGTNNIVVVPGAGYKQTITNQTANWVFHDPTNIVTSQSANPASQLYPLAPGAGQSVQVWVKVGYQFQINTCYIYYTTDGSNPEGSFGIGQGTTQTVRASFVNHDNVTSNIDWWMGTIPGQPNGTQVRYKVALFYRNIAQPISDSESSGSKLYGLTQYAVTNFNPTNALIWLHNDLNPANTTNGLQEGFHIVRARTFLPRSGKSSVFNTFSQTFYYDAQLPGGVIAFPSADGSNITSPSYTVVVRADANTTGVTYNISDSNPNNDDGVTGYPNGNGLSNGVPAFVPAQLVAPSGSLNIQYPNLPQEFHFNYAAVPSNGTATITIHLNKLTTSAYTNRFTALTRSVNTAAPAQSLEISSPSTDGQTLYLTEKSNYAIQACFSTSLTTTNTSYFTVSINGVTQPRTGTNGASLYSIGSSACGYGLNTLTYNWTGAQPGTNIIQINFTNSATTLSATRTVNVINPAFNITSITGDSSGRTIVWNSYSNLNYQVLATTNLNEPFQPISGVIPGNGGSTFYFDSSPNPVSEFYQVILIP
ncbi:MAG TPA: alpha-amylase family glycosyl hydrolase [Verrucomicrobiae bacterium]|nr:alpha-amylase family glycosyl hydrolase [Verrucomicrobiae bacterium]